jgi:hypothetical protein
MNKTVICLGAGYNQIQYIKELKKRKYDVICVDKTKNSPGFKFCTQKIISSTHDYTKTPFIIKKLVKKDVNIVGAIAPTTGNPYKTLQEIKKIYNLNYLHKKKYNLLLDKKMMRQRLNKLGCSKISIVNYNKINDKNFQPIVIKPRFGGSGSKDIKIILNYKDFKKNLSEIKKDKFIVEEMVKGKELAGDLIWADGTFKFINIGWHLFNKKTNEIVGATSQKIDRKIFDQFKRKVKKVCKNFGLDKEVINIDAIVDIKKNIHIIEIEFVPHEGIFLGDNCFNYNLVKNYVSCYLSEPIDAQFSRKKEAFVSVIDTRFSKKKENQNLEKFHYHKNLKKKKNTPSKPNFIGISCSKPDKIEKILKDFFKDLVVERSL